MNDFLDKMTTGEKALLGGSLLVLIALFMPWYGWDVVVNVGGAFPVREANGQSFNGLHSWGWLTVIGFLVVAGLWVIRTYLKDSVQLGDLGVSDAQVYMVGGGVELLGVVLFWVTAGPDIQLGFGSAGVRFGLFFALVGAVTTVIGGYLLQSEPQPVASGGGTAGGGSFTPATYTPVPPPPAAQPPAVPPPPPPPATPEG